MLQEEGNARNFPVKVPKYAVSISVHSYSLPVMYIGMFFTADKLFAHCWLPGVFVNVIVQTKNGETGRSSSCSIVNSS